MSAFVLVMYVWSLHHIHFLVELAFVMKISPVVFLLAPDLFHFLSLLTYLLYLSQECINPTSPSSLPGLQLNFFSQYHSFSSSSLEA